jgi:hypothetical protein
VSLRAERDHRVRGLQDRSRRAVVALELHDGRPREARRELEDVGDGRAAERVDRLRVVAHDHQPVAGGAQRREDVGLERVRVLVLVDQDVVEQLRDRGARRRVAAERVPEQEQVVVVERALRALALGVALEDRADRLALLGAPRVLAFEHLGELGAAVHGARVDVGERVLAREPPLALAEPQLAPDQVHQVGRVGPVQDREAGGQAERPAVEPEQPVGGRVEGAAPHAAERVVAGQLLGAREHLAGGAARERQQQDPLWRDPAIDQVRDPAGERPGLARAGTGDHQQGAAEVLDGRSLLRVEALHRVEHAFEQDRVAVRRGQGPERAGGRLLPGRAGTIGDMCRSIKRLREGDVPATETEIREAALQYVRKVSGYRAPSRRNEEAFNGAVDEVAEVSRRLLEAVTRSA